MKKFLSIILVFASCAGFAQMQMIVDSSGKLQYPTSENFKSANDIPTIKGVRINIDTTPTLNIESSTITRSRTTSFTKPYYINASGKRTATTNSNGTNLSTSISYYDSTSNFLHWTDAEFKVLDVDGNLIYWVSTQYGAQMGSEYTSHPAADLNAKIYYTCPEYEQQGTGWGRKWIEYVHNASNARTIYEHAQRLTGYSAPTIGGIIIQPNFDGTTVGGQTIALIFGTNSSNAPSGNQYIYLKCTPSGIERSVYSFPIWRTIQPQIILNGK